MTTTTNSLPAPFAVIKRVDGGDFDYWQVDVHVPKPVHNPDVHNSEELVWRSTADFKWTARWRAWRGIRQARRHQAGKSYVSVID